LTGIFVPVIPEIENIGLLETLVDAEQAAGIEADPLRRFAALLPRSRKPPRESQLA
jgi:hypothetical protein